MGNKIKLPQKSNTAFERKSVQFLLSGGVILSVTLMLVGLIALLWMGETSLTAVSILDIFYSDLGWAYRLLSFGMLILALTPAFRVITLLFLWWREKDWKFVGVSLAVLITLTLSLILGAI
ncbi:DUF1634 domain-containing protein [Pseudobdellovibrio exovorus]|uniref:DUF1634 domain-containing protein n=1 Tax=Pseudobdellovibrio exovorus JSS TaxID=1184267 RepID=M4VRZ6_9BACT|nr:DUF1634 domain-containing protein [Pseudobdellovibrio exovorus]AGH95954.1 hypothetical protein A11Q_1738 [Pseudobdellovibrio exovorus JSS]